MKGRAVPKLAVKKSTEVPSPRRATKAVQEQQRLYESFVQQVAAGDVNDHLYLPGL
jgi:hypothetical protein